MKIGFFGKLPGYGDFIHRNVPSSLIKNVDNWFINSFRFLQQKCPTSWKEDYLNSPIWRFVISKGVIDEHTISGFYMPSIDKAGRCYPFLLICQEELDVNPFSYSNNIDDFHQDAENIALTLLDNNRPNLDDLLSTFASVYQQFNGQMSLNKVAELKAEESLIMSIKTEQLESPQRANDIFLNSYLASKNVFCSVWWTIGGIGIEAQKRFYNGVPNHDQFSTFLLKNNGSVVR